MMALRIVGLDERCSGIEIVPPTNRGREVNTLLESMGCAEVRAPEYEAVEYENVWIAHASDMCVPLKPEREPCHDGVQAASMSCQPVHSIPQLKAFWPRDHWVPC